MCTVYLNFCCLQLQKYDEPVLTTADIHKKRDVVERVCKPIASKPPPKKEAPAPAPQPAAAAADAAPEPAAAADGDDTPMEAAGAAAEGEDTPMEQ
jgi:heat shock protein 4